MSGDINWRAEAFAEYDPNLNEIKKLDTLMHAFWILLQKTNGFTNEMLDEAELNIASGNTIPSEEVWLELEDEFAHSDAHYAASFVSES